MNTNAAVEPARRRTPKRTTDVEVGKRVHQLMWSRQITQTQFAAELEMDQSSLAKKIRGQRGWALDEIAAVAELLEVSIATLFGETEPGNPMQNSFWTIASVTDLATWQSAKERADVAEPTVSERIASVDRIGLAS